MISSCDLIGGASLRTEPRRSVAAAARRAAFGGAPAAPAAGVPAPPSVGSPPRLHFGPHPRPHSVGPKPRDRLVPLVALALQALDLALQARDLALLLQELREGPLDRGDGVAALDAGLHVHPRGLH